MSLLGRLGSWVARSGRESLTVYKETLGRLRTGSFDDLTPEAREAQVELIIQAGARAAVLASSAPIPFLEMPVLALMVQAIARVYGVERSTRKVMAELAGAMGGGLVLRQLFRRLPIIGALTQSARIHATTLALGYTAKRHYAAQALRAEPQKQSNQSTPEMALQLNPAVLHEVFESTLERCGPAQNEIMQQLDFDAKLQNLREQRERGEISESEYTQQRDKLLEQL